MNPARPRRGRLAWPGARPAAAATLLLLQAGPAAAAPEAGADALWRLALHTRHHSDASELAQDEVQGSELAPRSGRNLAYIDDEARIERQQGGWTWGLLARSRATLVASEDTLQLYRQIDSGSPVDRDRRWDVDARLRGFSGRGALVGRSHALGQGWSADWQVQALVLQRLRQRHIRGAVQTAAADDSYDFALTSTQSDDRLQFPFQSAHASQGSALLGQLALAWQGERWRVDGAVHDAGWLRWRGLPRQDATLDTRTAAVDAEGYLIYRPLIQGQNSQANARIPAPAWASWAARWQCSHGAAAEAGADALPGFGWLPWLGARMPWGMAQAALRWETHERRLTLQWQWRGLSLTAGADRLGAAARSRALGLAWQLPL